jgi:hypothetical protein
MTSRQDALFQAGDPMMLRRARAASLSAVLLMIGLAAGCGDSPTAPTATVVTETFSGTLSPLGISIHTFNVNYAEAYSDASVTVTRLATVADGSERQISVGVGFGTISVGVCTRAAALTNATAPYNVELPTNGSPFLAGPFCVAVFDNTDAPTVTEPLLYTLTVKHY